MIYGSRFPQGCASRKDLKLNPLALWTPISFRTEKKTTDNKPNNMKKRVILFILLAALMAATIFSIRYQAPSSSMLTTSTTTEELDDGSGTVTTTTFTDLNGHAVVAADKGYAAVRKTLNSDGKVILEEYLDERGEPILLSSGYASIRYDLENGLATEIKYLGEDGEPVVINNGYDSIHRTYNDQGLAETDTYWAEGQPVMRKQGYAEYKRTYNDKKQAIMLEYRDLSGELTNTTSGYARRIREFNSSGKVSEERYYTSTGDPAVLSLGQSGYTRAYDDQGRTIETTYLGEHGERINTNKGYSRVTTTYGEDGSSRVRYFDVDGKAVTIGNSNYGILTTGGDTGTQRIYLDEDGEVMNRLDNILGTRPYLVLVLCVILTITALCLRGHVRWVFLFLYLAFIAYMTMYYREPGDQRTRFELFASYKRFLTNSGTRQQIINNILLFLPFGTVICSLLPFKSAWNRIEVTILICAGVSVIIEAVQYVAGIGLAEADDVVSNTIGGAVGAGLAALWKPKPVERLSS